MNSSDILYEDNHLLVINKPAGLLTQPSGTTQPSAETWAKEWIKIKYQKPGNVFLEAVHRLDKPVSGVVVFGRTSKALSRLNETIRSKQAKKSYYALVEGQLPSQQGDLQHYLIHDDFQAQIVSQEYPQAKLARLTYRILRQKGNYTFLQIELETGRYHQIRSQLAYIGCPIIGDVKYGAKTLFASDAIGLHHFQLQIAHPITLQLLKFEAPLSSSFAHFL